MKIIFLFFVVFDIFSVLSTANTPPCGDWEQYKDEHCYKLFDTLQSYEAGKGVCQANNSTLVSIHYAEEQNFLSNFLFTKSKAVDNVWIGAKYAGNKLYQWEADHTQLSEGSFSNWATGSPKNLSDYCVQMLADVSHLGKWEDEPCTKKNIVVCQRTPSLSIRLLSETMIEMKHSLRQLSEQLANNKADLENSKKEIAQLKKENIPLGFIYVQMPKDKSPSELWPSMTWKEISSDYEGVFFRVAGGDAAQFGQVQQGNAPRLETVYISDKSNSLKGQKLSGNHNLTVPVTGWSDAIITGSSYIYSDAFYYYMNFKQTDTSEVRPKNMAIRVFRRTA